MPETSKDPHYGNKNNWYLLSANFDPTIVLCVFYMTYVYLRCQSTDRETEAVRV